jgi:hypothetical protein
LHCGVSHEALTRGQVATSKEFDADDSCEVRACG